MARMFVENASTQRHRRSPALNIKMSLRAIDRSVPAYCTYDISAQFRRLAPKRHLQHLADNDGHFCVSLPFSKLYDKARKVLTVSLEESQPSPTPPTPLSALPTLPYSSKPSTPTTRVLKVSASTLAAATAMSPVMYLPLSHALSAPTLPWAC
jgi:hypothetical protein